ncbi:COX15/CtaA family protein [Hymenobacter jejuensis]|uniref:Heme A synthase n=1 Tax=Hymenobacter jejuensis TaxID=2502781 RepID=A0A5B8A1W0_9BACT|nr:COX15/CtaA family protein [Hymenobacter jejuensis]QDA61119.1 heme A synthase [Hymenobacter jejuensis]
MEKPSFVKRFRFIAIATVIAVYVLILVGGVVRSTGSGMGCPDWPKCFGAWVPPTQISQLPANYKEVYTAKRVEKNKKLAATLERLGFRQVAGDIFSHPNQYIETDFNPIKTWIEYVNRLVGALIGVLVFLTVLFALPYWRIDRKVFWLSFWSFLLTGVQGWLGSLVVSTNLLPIMVTIHMGLALLIVAMLIYAVSRSQREYVQDSPGAVTAGLMPWLWLVTLLTFIQIVLGTQVREQVDIVSFTNNYVNREHWIEELGSIFRFHRTLSALLLFVNVYVAYRLYLQPSKKLHQYATTGLALLGLELVAGVTLAAFSLPPLVQPVHLTVATLIFGIQFLTIITYRQQVKSDAKKTYPTVVA